MPIAAIIAEIDAEISRLEQARSLLGQLATPTLSMKDGAAPAKRTPTRRKLSAAARERIATAQRKRWAEQKAAKLVPDKVAKKAAPAKKHPASRMSTAGRKRIAAAQKKRWAAIKAGKSVQKAAPAKKTASAKRAASKKVAPTPVPTATAAS